MTTLTPKNIDLFIKRQKNKWKNEDYVFSKMHKPFKSNMKVKKHNWYIYPYQVTKVARIAKEMGISQSKLIRDLIDKI